MLVRRIVLVLVQRPILILCTIALFAGVCFVLPFTKNAFPDFSDPQMGFETRGTKLSSRIITWKNLIEATKPSGTLTSNPQEYLIIKNSTKNVAEAIKKPKQRKLKMTNNHDTSDYCVNDEPFDDDNPNDRGIIVTEQQNQTEDKSHANWLFLKNFVKHPDFFCGAPDDNYVQFVVKSDTGEDLFNFESLFTICRMERELLKVDLFRELCIETQNWRFQCCRPWSLPNYVALLHNRATCLSITEDDVKATKSLLIYCSKYYHSLQLDPNCASDINCQGVPRECQLYNAVFNIFNYLTSSSFLPANETGRTKLEETMMFLPMACSVATLPYYKSLKESHLKLDGISVVAMEFGLKNALFDETLLKDAWFMAFGGVFVVFCMWIYTHSLFLTVMTIVAIGFSLGISYFFYTFVYNMEFFPFMNLLTGVIVIGIGADDAFIFCKLWQLVKKDDSYALTQIMIHTVNHALISMFVTSLTTAVAFLASYLSSITALRCFGIFAGTTVIANYILMITWLPASAVLLETYPLFQCVCTNRFINCLSNKSQSRKQCLTRMRKSLSCIDRFRNEPEEWLIEKILKYKYIFFAVLTGAALISSLAIFYYPKLQIPNTNELQLFTSNHPFEQYDLFYKQKFWFKKIFRVDSSSVPKLPIRFVWGVLPIDNGDFTNPRSTGSLVYDDAFNISDPESQEWLLNFCRELRKQRFYQSSFGPMLTNCFIESFVDWMERDCRHPINPIIDRTPCCNTSAFPYPSDVFNLCIKDALVDLYKTPTEFLSHGIAGPKFSKAEKPELTVIVIEFDSNYDFTMSYQHVDEFVTHIDVWMSKKLSTAPDALKHGWYVSDLEFYDLQRELPTSTFLAVALSMLLSLIVLFFTTLNVLNSLFVVCTIICSITTTLGVLVLMDWKLNVLESVAVSSTIGLTIDYSLHYAVNYKLCPENLRSSREEAIRYALSRMMGPAAMGALTTGAAGAFMIPSMVLAYRQIGQFLIIVMSVSWLYATFHLGSLFAIAGPQQRYGQYEYSQLFAWCKSSNATSQHPSTTSTQDSHEMENLASASDIRRPNLLEVQVVYECNVCAQNDVSPTSTSSVTIV